MKPWMMNLRKIEPYVPGEQPKSLHVTKLNTNENPYPPAPGVRRALAEMTDERGFSWGRSRPGVCWRGFG